MPTTPNLAAMERVCVAARAYRDGREGGLRELCDALDDLYPTTPRYRLSVNGRIVITHSGGLASLVRYAASAFPGRAVVFESEVQPA